MLDVKSLKRKIKNQLKHLKLSYHRRFRGYDPVRFSDALSMIGINVGDSILVHTSYDKFIGFSGKPSDVISALQNSVGEQGTLLMPSMPFTDTAYRYIHSGKTFNVKRTPSAMGLVSELFRRQKHTVRSLHPTHPVLANGFRSKEMLASHSQSLTPCGQFSPFQKLLEQNGKILLLGTGINVLTFYHYLEEYYEQQLPKSPFTSESFDVTLKDYEGNDCQVSTRLFDPIMSKGRRLGPLETQLREQGKWKESNLGALKLILLNTKDISDCFQEMLKKKIYCYETS